MADKTEDGSGKPEADVAPMELKDPAAGPRRAVLKKLGRFAGVTAPTVTLLLAAAAKPEKAQASSVPPPSSMSLKSTSGTVDPASILASVTALPVGAWHYKPETGLKQRTHIGPYAEDFKAAFGVGDGMTISTIDAIGVCLAAIKALSEKVETLEGDIRAARRRPEA